MNVMKALAALRNEFSFEDLESFIDPYSHFGFHITEYDRAEKIRHEGLLAFELSGPCYFIADRLISDCSIVDSWGGKREMPKKVIGGEEYIDRFLNSIVAGRDNAYFGHHYSPPFSMIIIDREKGLPPERADKVASGEIPEFRGGGFANLDLYGPLLDEGGMADERDQRIPGAAIVSVLKMEVRQNGSIVDLNSYHAIR